MCLCGDPTRKVTVTITCDGGLVLIFEYESGSVAEMKQSLRDGCTLQLSRKSKESKEFLPEENLKVGVLDIEVDELIASSSLESLEKMIGTAHHH